MPVDPVSEESFLLSEAKKYIPRVSQHQLRRWIIHGKVREDGAMIHLEKCLLPGGMGTSVEAYHRFLRNLNGLGDLNAPSGLPDAPTPTGGQSASTSED